MEKEEVPQVLPDRPIRILNTGMSQRGALGSAIFFALAIIALCMWQVPILKRDYDMRDTYRILPAGVVDGQCRTAVFVLTICAGTINVQRLNGRISRVIALAYLDTNWGESDILVDVIHAPDDLRQMTITPAVEKVENRILTFGLVVGVLGIFLISGLVSSRNGTRMKHLTRKPLRLKLVAIREQGQLGGSSGELSFTYADADGQMQSATSTFEGAEKPFLLLTGEHLAVLPEGSHMPIPMDKKLKRLKLSKRERAAITAAFVPPSLMKRVFG